MQNAREAQQISTAAEKPVEEDNIANEDNNGDDFDFKLDNFDDTEEKDGNEEPESKTAVQSATAAPPEPVKQASQSKNVMGVPA